MRKLKDMIKEQHLIRGFSLVYPSTKGWITLYSISNTNNETPDDVYEMYYERMHKDGHNDEWIRRRLIDTTVVETYFSTSSDTFIK